MKVKSWEEEGEEENERRVWEREREEGINGNKKNGRERGKKGAREGKSILDIYSLKALSKKDK